MLIDHLLYSPGIYEYPCSQSVLARYEWAASHIDRFHIVTTLYPSNRSTTIPSVPKNLRNTQQQCGWGIIQRWEGGCINYLDLIQYYEDPFCNATRIRCLYIYNADKRNETCINKIIHNVQLEHATGQLFPSFLLWYLFTKSSPCYFLECRTLIYKIYMYPIFK